MLLPRVQGEIYRCDLEHCHAIIEESITVIARKIANQIIPPSWCNLWKMECAENQQCTPRLDTLFHRDVAENLCFSSVYSPHRCHRGRESVPSPVWHIPETKLRFHCIAGLSGTACPRRRGTFADAGGQFLVFLRGGRSCCSVQIK